jgi:hypothetical protein
MTITTTEYLPFNEHSIAVRKLILDKHSDVNVDYEWYESTIEAYIEALEMIGFSNAMVLFSGFSCQGDGAQFNGSYSYERGAAAKVKQKYPDWTEIHELAEHLQEASRKYFYAVSFDVRNDGRYSHEHCTAFTFEGYTERRGVFWLTIDQESEFIEPCRAFMRSIYKDLEKEYDGLTSEDAVKSTLLESEMEFDKLGKKPDVRSFR